MTGVEQSKNTLQAINYTRGHLAILDQLKLPHESVYLTVPDTTTAWHAIKTMQVRGAPAIAIVAALSLAVELHTSIPNATVEVIDDKLAYLVSSRPTAVNMADAAGKLSLIIREAQNEGRSAVEAYIEAAERMLVDDVADNMNIGRHGAEWIMVNTSKQDDIRVLTHCNTGSLATASYGTALGIIRSLHSFNALSHAFCTETRPYNQGSRLTAYELVHEQIPATLITDSMASALMRQTPIHAVIVGADRVARNGDTANKIGTYQLAIVARYHGVKFIVAAPTTSVDLLTAHGKDIKIEMRDGWEVVTVSGPTVNGKTSNLEEVRTIKIAADGVGTYNPSFDVTPAELIDAIVTEKGVVVKNELGVFDMEGLFKKD